MDTRQAKSTLELGFQQQQKTYRREADNSQREVCIDKLLDDGGQAHYCTMTTMVVLLHNGNDGGTTARWRSSYPFVFVLAMAKTSNTQRAILDKPAIQNASVSLTRAVLYPKLSGFYLWHKLSHEKWQKIVRKIMGVLKSPPILFPYPINTEVNTREQYMGIAQKNLI